MRETRFVSIALTALCACTVNLGDGRVYSCSSDADCGGDGFVCQLSSANVLGQCCKPTATHRCDSYVPDGGCTAQLSTDPNNCGACGFRCNAGEQCKKVQCVPSTETQCGDGIDNDENGLTDCADPACDGRSCGPGCSCEAGARHETACGDGLDNDSDGQIDCVDPDCDGASCGAGCVCGGGAAHEADCADGVDNDSDGLTDCADPDCALVGCKPAPATFVCTALMMCTCNGGAPQPEDGGVACRDGIDNDCDGLTDCAEQACDLSSCNPDGGAGCVCAGHKKTETNCGDGIDNDFDGLVDCADFLDCPAPVNCTVFTDGGQHGGTCGMDHLCH